MNNKSAATSNDEINAVIKKLENHPSIQLEFFIKRNRE